MGENLLVTFDPTHSEGAKKEIETLLTEIGEKAKIGACEEGLAKVNVKDPKKAVKKLIGICKKDSSKFKHTFNWIPADKWCKSTVGDMQKTIKAIIKDIKTNDKWKMDLGKRKAKDYEKDLIIKLTEVVDRLKVDLKNPDKIVKVEIIADKAAISLLTPDELLNVVKIKG